MRYKTEYRVMSGQIDFLHHLSNVQYYEMFKSAMFSLLFKWKYFELNGAERIMPVVFSDGCEYHKEVFFDELVTVEIYFGQLSEKRHKWYCHGIMYNEAGEKVATYKCFVGNMNLVTRRIQPLPQAIIDLFLDYSEN
jgi:acyl-CoA thioesterase FadM